MQQYPLVGDWSKHPERPSVLGIEYELPENELNDYWRIRLIHRDEEFRAALRASPPAAKRGRGVALRKATRIVATNQYRAPGNLTPRAWVMIVSEFGGRCAYCRAMCDPCLDHVVSVVRGGVTSMDNVVPSCKGCNSHKRAKYVERWLSEDKLTMFLDGWHYGNVYRKKRGMPI